MCWIQLLIKTFDAKLFKVMIEAKYRSFDTSDPMVVVVYSLLRIVLVLSSSVSVWNISLLLIMLLIVYSWTMMQGSRTRMAAKDGHNGKWLVNTLRTTNSSTHFMIIICLPYLPIIVGRMCQGCKPFISTAPSVRRKNVRPFCSSTKWDHFDLTFHGLRNG